MDETFLKAKILTNGVIFSDEAIKIARNTNAKGQNLVYNAPQNLSGFRPQELLIIHDDGYETVSSCVASCTESPVMIDYIDNRLVAVIDGKCVENITIEFVKEPNYYTKKISNGSKAKKYVSACGYDELNILPWLGCNISSGCLFCGTNSIAKMNADDILTADSISNHHAWEKNKLEYLKLLNEAIDIAKNSDCYADHMHVILISGDLCDNKLDYQSKIYCEIAKSIYDKVKNSTDGIVAVLMPPKNTNLLFDLCKSGIKKVVFNLEVGNRELFNKYCPGKANIGYDHIMDSLRKSVEIFKKGNVWTNFVLGLEPVDSLLKLNARLAGEGIVSGANVLHLDKGNRLECRVPCYDDVVSYFYELSCIMKLYNQQPFYCSKALRTSLSNEAYDGRIVL